ncbi:MAG: hypothetical protein A2X34_07990 [Elusimicrobia bacterium GWC2_51_8]|nr:MAG: hypothetical protein A2X33_03230 [Elusimicrobia bacterium GWA2_51_34]OGR58473.1 MAG: hypothetical protein A2X34_07990 [Elusimicrobia bacterium GWC2_51_8]OGR87831.1 MAG: hypothetical protein A2021_05470 [Elusimicrobia bacterium GWF2_52_66]HAF94847.1 hypothetical protein [Elusimicrobiota bacterium]HCE97193.1 hypothetical protein [Elusimicrobiota bacterium]
MRKKTAFLFTFLLLPCLVSAEEVRILAINGSVEARQAAEGQWVSATQNMEIAEGGAIRTGADGSAVALMPNKTKVWLKESTSLEIEQRRTLASRLALAFGSIKLRVPHLLRKEKFEVRTPAAVCAVRGTEFTMETTESGKMGLNVLYGEVKLNFIVPPSKGPSELYIPQGRNLSLDEKGKPGKLTLMDPKQERAALENWNPGLKPEERQKELKAKENDRAQIKEFAKVTNNSERAVKGFLNVVKESDLEAGRTLSDVHGNLVRVDQRMMRPDNNTIQFFNLVKRPSYADYTARAHGFRYNGGVVTNRLDLMQMNMKFDKALPQRIDEWPSFFSSNSVNPVYASVIMANRTGTTDIFFIAQGYKYDAANDEMVNNDGMLAADGVAVSLDQDVIMTGVLTDDSVNSITAMEGLNRISRLAVTKNGGTGGLKYVIDNKPVGGDAGDVRWAQSVENTPSYSYDAEDVNSDQLWNYSANLYAIGGGAGEKIWFTTENYVINNSGSIQTKDSITNSGSDPFTLLKNVAGEAIFSVKSWQAGALPYDQINNDAGGDRFGTKNIDIVFIPDLLVAAVQRMLPAITDIGK